MRRLTEAWFEFKGIRSSDMGIKLRKMATRTVPGVSISRKNVSGRDGTLRYGRATDDDVTVKIECDAVDDTKITQIMGWLTGSGDLRFSDEPNLAYDASIEKEYTRSQILARYAGQRFTVAWTCAPHRRLYPEAEPITITTSGTQIINPGTAAALPRIEITGSGDFSLTIGMQTAFFSGVDGGIIVDSELGDALTTDGAQLANDRMDGELYAIQPGANVVSWLTGGEDADGNATTGSVRQVKITPRWRYR